MTSRHTQTIQPKQLAQAGGCNAVAMHLWTPSFNINSLERGYDPASGVLDEKKVI